MHEEAPVIWSLEEKSIVRSLILLFTKDCFQDETTTPSQLKDIIELLKKIKKI